MIATSGNTSESSLMPRIFGVATDLVVEGALVVIRVVSVFVTRILGGIVEVILKAVVIAEVSVTAEVTA